MKKIVLVLMLLSGSLSGESIFAKASKTGTKGMEPIGVIVVVKGMVCSFCARGIEKKLKAFKEVKTVDVGLDNKKVTVQFILGQKVADEKLHETIKNAGYEIVEIKELRPQQ